MKEQIAKIKENSVKEISQCKEEKELNELKVKYLGKKGMVTELTKNMRDLSDEKRREVGKISNEVYNDGQQKKNLQITKMLL